jgi:N-acetylglucosaminyl-diphospho-decaprenol L-rhamnosyltransferase
MLSVVVLSWNTMDLTLACLRSLGADVARHTREVIVIDNGSADGSADAIEAQHPDVRLIRNDENVGYAGGHNQGAAVATGRYLCTLNSDTEVHPGALDRLVDYLDENSDHGAVSPRLVNVDQSVQPACMRFPGLLVALCFDTIFGKFWPGSAVESRYFMRDFDHLSSRDVDQPPGAVFLMKREEFLEMGGLDEELFLFFNDVDICRRLWKRGRKIHYLADAVVTHHGGASTKGFSDFVVIWHRNRMAYYRKHYGLISVPYVRMMVRLRALEEWFRAGRADPQSRRAARADLKAHVQEILAR